VPFLHVVFDELLEDSSDAFSDLSENEHEQEHFIEVI
jgi:hypothetical protein